ncbi:MAG: D-cysteine desulfhydrase family protein [Candidatus Aminicenantes bacterium]|nr:D-cysteine desulfhydrase family protein [Candidatus Aminicenantes bacterium]
MTTYSIPEIKAKIKKFPKVDLIHAPTPFRKLTNLTKELGGPEIYIKRDDLTGLAFGGNKSRKLEFIIPDIQAKGADVVITWASLQSNWCLQTAAAARKFGITPILILFKTYDLPDEYDGNLLLDLILKADIKVREADAGKVLSKEDVDGVLDEVVLEVKEWGHRPYVAPIGGSMVGGSMDRPLGAVGYVNAYAEMLEQTNGLGFQPDYVIHATGSGGTQAGLVFGAKALSPGTKVLGISVSDEKAPFSKDVLTIAKDTEKAFDMDLSIQEDDIIVFDEYLEDGYGFVTKSVVDSIRFVALHEAIFIDPVYTGKAMVALRDLVVKGSIEKNAKVVFFHTGGTAALFPNKHKITSYLND